MTTKLEDTFQQYLETRAEVIDLRKEISKEPDPQEMYDRGLADLDSWYEERRKRLEDENRLAKKARAEMLRKLNKHTAQLVELSDRIKGLAGSDCAGVIGAKTHPSPNGKVAPAADQPLGD